MALLRQGAHGKAYGFCYDDVSDQAAFFSGQGRTLTVTLYWDSRSLKPATPVK